jgi:hypothetical protein
MSDWAVFALYMLFVMVAAVIGVTVSDWVGASRFSKRLTALERMSKEQHEMLIFMLRAMNAYGVVKVEEKGAAE